MSFTFEIIFANLKTHNNHISSLYQPIQTFLRSFNLLDSLYLIWGYSRNFTFDLPFPDDIEKPFDFNPTDDINKRRFRGLPEFEQEYLLKEFLINCNLNSSRSTLKQKENLAELIYYIRWFSNEIDKHHTIPNDFLLEFNRIAHRQFRWQLGYSQNEIIRYYKIYSSPDLSVIVKNKFKISTYQIFIIGFVLFNWTAKHFKSAYPLKTNVDFLSNEMIEIFFNHFSIPIEQAINELKEGQNLNENIFYSYNPLLAKPILIYQNSFICPLHLQLFWQVTSGIYYSIVKEKGFEIAFGNSFQNYVGEVLFKSCSSPKIQIFEERTYGSPEKRTTDWIIEDEDAILFIECKAKRMTMGAKTEFDIKNGLESDLKKMSSFITQIYKTYVEYRNDKYPQVKFQLSKNFIPLVVTLEDWYLNINPKILGMLKDLVIEGFKTNKMDIELLETFPYHIRSVSVFERDIQLINSLGISEYFRKVKHNEIHEYMDSFKFETHFEDEFEATFMSPLGL